MAQERQQERQQERRGETQKNAPQQQAIQPQRPEQQGLERPQQQQRETQLARPDLANSFSFMRRFVDQMDGLFSDFGFGGLEAARAWVPALETLERDGKIVFRVDLPGTDTEDVKVEVLGDQLVISGERRQEEQKTREGQAYSEVRYGSFERRIVLPEGYDPETIEARIDNGVLEISLNPPKSSKQEPKKIDVKSKKEEGGPTGTGSVH